MSNKLCALTRMEPKDVADIIFIAKNYSYEWEEIMSEARRKDLWAAPLEICKAIDTFPIMSLNEIKWIHSVDIEEMKINLAAIHEDIFYGRANSLK